MTEEIEDKKFLEFVVKSIVDHPSDVKIERTVDEMGVLLSLHVHPDDMGQVIGRSGATARAIRTLIRIIGLKSHSRVNLKIEEPEGGRSRPASHDASRSEVTTRGSEEKKEVKEEEKEAPKEEEEEKKEEEIEETEEKKEDKDLGDLDL